MGQSLQSFGGKNFLFYIDFIENFLIFIDFIPRVVAEDFPVLLGLFEGSEQFLGALMGIFPP